MTNHPPAPYFIIINAKQTLILYVTYSKAYNHKQNVTTKSQVRTKKVRYLRKDKYLTLKDVVAVYMAEVFVHFASKTSSSSTQRLTRTTNSLRHGYGKVVRGISEISLCVLVNKGLIDLLSLRSNDWYRRSP